MYDILVFGGLMPFSVNGYQQNTGWGQPPRPQAPANQWQPQGMYPWQPQNAWQPRPQGWQPQGGQTTPQASANQWSVNQPQWEANQPKPTTPQWSPMPQNEFQPDPRQGSNQDYRPRPQGSANTWTNQSPWSPPFRAQQNPPMNPYPAGGNVMLSAMNMLR